MDGVHVIVGGSCDSAPLTEQRNGECGAGPAGREACHAAREGGGVACVQEARGAWHVCMCAGGERMGF